MNEISAFIKRGQKASSLSFCYVRIHGGVSHPQPGKWLLLPEPNHTGTRISHFQTPEL